ncbi:MAG: hypothetical protein IT450_10995 [Phycisphaerales bacterium]|nr:hypothetical protein [Phycisphaerales bacterium]
MSHLFRAGEPPPQADHPDCETAPLLIFSNASWNISDGIVRLLRRHTQLDLEQEDQVRTCIQEVTQNVIDHAESSIGGVMVARYLHSKHEVRVAVVDRGIGIASSLRKRYSEMTDSSRSLERVIEGGFTSLSRPNNLGLGVSNLFKLVETATGRMALFSGDAFADFRPGLAKPIISKTGCDFPGTAAFFTLPVGVSVK